MSALLESRDVCKYFGGLKAVEKVSMKVEKGDVFGIIGPNGAGKTTFFKAVSPRNVLTPTDVTPFGNVIFSSVVHPAKAPAPIDVTVCGNCTSVKDVQPANAYPPISERTLFSATEKEVSPVQPENVASSIWLTPDGNTIPVIAVLALNAL